MIPTSVLKDFPLKRTKRVRIKNKIVLNETTKLDVSIRGKNMHVEITGQTGKGKSVDAAIIASQQENFIFFDPKGDFMDTLELDFLNEKQNWKFLELGEGEKISLNQLRINVRDVGIYANQIIFFSRGRMKSAEIEIRPKLRDFFLLSPLNPKKNFANLKAIFEEHPKAMDLFEEMKRVLHPTDEGVNMLELQRGKWCVDMSNFEGEEKSFGFLLGALLDFRVRNKAFRKRHRLGIGVDEIDTFGKRDTASGTAIGFIFARSRAFNTFAVVVGTTRGDLHKLIKANIAISMWFYNPQEWKLIESKYRIFLDFDVYNVMEKQHPEGGNCFLLAPAFGFVEPKPIHINTFYQKMLEDAEKGFESSILYDFSDEKSVTSLIPFI